MDESPTTTADSGVWAEARHLLSLGLPLVLAQLAQISMHTADTVMAGHLSSKDLAAVALGGAIWTPTWILGMGVLLSIGPTVSQLFGAGRYQEIGVQVRQGLWLSQCLAWFIVAIVWHADRLLVWFDVDPQLTPLTVAYTRSIVWGLPAVCLQCVLRSFSEAVGQTRPILGICLIGFLVNILGNWVLMYGKFGFPRLGAAGCGISSACSMWVMTLALATWIVWRPEYQRYGVLARFDRPHWPDQLTLLRLGVPVGIGLFMEGTLFATASLFLGEFGAEVIAGHQAALNVTSVTFMVPLGIAIAVSVRVGQAVGRGDEVAARRAGLVGLGLCVVLMAGAAVLLLSIPQAIARCYSLDPKVIALISSLLPLVALTQVFDGAQVAGASALRGLKDTTATMYLTTASYWCVGIPVSWLLAVKFSLQAHGIWLGFLAGLVAASTSLTLRFLLVTRLRIAGQAVLLGDTLPEPGIKEGAEPRTPASSG